MQVQRHTLIKGSQSITVEKFDDLGLVWLASSKRPAKGMALYMVEDARRIWREHLADGFVPPAS